MSQQLVCDNPACDTMVDADTLADLAEARADNREASALPVGWVSVSEIDDAGDDVMVGECCSRQCAAALITLGDVDG